jgi:hypothetical protein
MVPTQILLSTGQASVSEGASPTLKMPNFNIVKPTRELDVTANDTWTAQWQVSPVTNSDDLRKLRNLYVLIVSTDEQYDQLEAYYNRNPQMRASAACYGLQTTAGGGAQSAAQAGRASGADATGQPPTANAQDAACPPGYGAGQIPKWREALVVIEYGDSIGCKLYQEAWATSHKRASHDSTAGIPFRRWLFWRRLGGDWLPATPDTEPQVLGLYKGWELGTTSRACFNDFVILAQSATPATANASQQGARVMLNTP